MRYPAIGKPVAPAADNLQRMLKNTPPPASLPRKRETRRGRKHWIPAGVYPALDTGQE
jgi:hypothetical protein